MGLTVYCVTLHLDNFNETEWIEFIIKYHIFISDHKYTLKTLCLTNPNMMGNVQNISYI
jgi:hypothetical protein